MTRTAIALLAAAFAVACFVLVTNGTAVTPTRSQPRQAAAAQPGRVLMIGDSLSVGPFGRSVQAHLESRRFKVAAYASCGSSPEHWLADQPSFSTTCGYRESTAPDREKLVDYVNGRRPPSRITPKLETLIGSHRPNIVIIQLGTNWMDRDLSPEKMNEFLDQLMLRARGGNKRRVIWITPPDSAALARVQNRYHALIKNAAKRHGVEIVDSMRMTNYVRGKTGGDGIHYNTASSLDWASKVNRRLDETLARGGRQLATTFQSDSASPRSSSDRR